MFNKEQYWSRRNNKFHVKNKEGEIVKTILKPIRGQIGGNIEPKVVNITRGINRKQRRFKIVDRTFTKKGYHFGVKIDSRQYNKMHYLAKKQAE